jgi:signal transduction histidine kinase
MNLEGLNAYGSADAAMFSDPATYPVRVVKVTIPWLQTQDAITQSRAILTAIGILTVFLAMVILYVIIRYVVVKPLKHLRDVSEEISRGNTELRAEINTNDEFEELAGAFNRMLRHLTEAQAELRQVNVDLDAKVDQLAQLNMRLYEMNRLKSDFLTNMSHEVRTPLNSIIGFSEVLQGIDTLNDKQKRYAQNIQTSGRLLLDLINDILDLAKIEAGKMDLRRAEFRIDAVVHAQCDVVRSLSEEKNIDLKVRVEPDLPAMYQDQSRIQQILLNLLSNAIKFTPEGGLITVSAKRDAQNRLVMSIADTGVGIAEEDREVIFEKFRQSSQTGGEGNLTREYSGTGLGLSIVKELCKLLGGEITFESVLGKGSTFTVTLPWTLVGAAQRESELEAHLDELVKSQPPEFDKKKQEAPEPDLSATATT